MIESDRISWINTFEKNFDKVLKGAIFFIGKILWSSDRIYEVQYSLTQVLKFFNTIIVSTDKFSVLNEILTATKMLAVSRDIQLYFEWEIILKIVENVTQYSDTLVQKKRIEIIHDIFKAIRNLIMLDKFPDFLINQSYKVYFQFKNNKAISDKTLTQMATKYLL